MRQLRSPAFLVAVSVVLLLIEACSGGGSSAPPQESAAGSPTTEATPAPPVFVDTECPFFVPAERKPRCGFILVPEDRGKADGRKIRIRAAVFKSESATPAADPIVFLDGGPGSNTLEGLQYDLEVFVPLLAERDLVFFDQRGAGSSDPPLECAEVKEMFYGILGEPVTPEEHRAQELRDAGNCRETLSRSGADLAAYNSAENAADLEDLRLALGYAQWNLYGASYGTRLALTAMRDFPAGIRSVVLDSTYPLQVDLFEEVIDSNAAALSALFAGCADDPACSANYPALEDVFYEQMQALDGQPAAVPLYGPRGEYRLLTFNGYALTNTVIHGLYLPGGPELLPRMIYDTLDGDFSIASVIDSSVFNTVELLSFGMYLSIECHDEAPFSNRETAGGSASRHPELAGYVAYENPELLLDACQVWAEGWAPPDPKENAAVNSPIPTLVLAGEYDPVTPPSWGRLVSADLPNSRYFEFPGLGHGVTFAHDCPREIMKQFLADPAGTPSGACIEQMGGPEFISPFE